jgi:predicted CXXCH cytochrome family protein
MHADRPHRTSPMLALLPLWAALGAAGLLLAQAAEPPASEPARTATTRPAPRPAELPLAPGAPQPRRDAASQREAREALLSGLIGSKHDFSQGVSGRDLCLPCHTPHLVVGTPQPALDRRATTPQPLRPYQALGVELTGWSLLCLGCHDGVTAPDVYSTGHAIQVSNQLAGTQLGARGLRSHPVGIRYPLTDPHYHPPAAVEAGGLLLPDGRIQCITCHDAHNTNRHAGLLWRSDERSQLCLTCHRL